MTHRYLLLPLLALAFCLPLRAQPLAVETGAIPQQMKRAFEWQIANPKDLSENSWQRGAFYTGVLAAWHATQDEAYLKQALAWGRRAEWLIQERYGSARNPDNLVATQSYLELYLLQNDPVVIAHTRAAMDAMAAEPQPGREEWWWADALYMAPPAWTLMTRITGDRKYLDHSDRMWWDTTDFLFDPEFGFFHRDKGAFPARTRGGHKYHWARGQGWVMAGLVRTIEHLPEDYASRPRYIELLRTMAASAARTQPRDGMWRSAMLDPESFPMPETSGTAMMCYAIAWGINNGHLDRATYLPVVERAWNGLVRAQFPSGMVGWVQQVAATPGPVSPHGSHEYGTGAFLLAGSEMLRLTRGEQR
jgi:unsaturated rhamnogalacturonyl hydrolase